MVYGFDLGFCCLFLKQDRDSREEFCRVRANLWTLAKVAGAVGYQSQTIFQKYRKVEMAQTPLILGCRTII